MGISEYYNDAYMMVENNDVGALVCEKLWYDTVRFQRQFGVQLRRFWQAHQASLKGSHGTQ
jgi:hypothetical protein